MAIEDYNGMPDGVSPDKLPVSRSAEFSAGTSGGGSTHSVQQTPPLAYTPQSVISALPNNNGQSDNTFTANKVLDYYR